MSATDLPSFINAASNIITQNEAEVARLDQAIGDGDHVVNLQRGLAALTSQSSEFAELNWKKALQKIGMTLMSTMGGASGSLLGTLFISMAKAIDDKEEALNLAQLSLAFNQGVEAMKKRGKSDLGEKTMLDTLIPVAEALQLASQEALPLTETFERIKQTAISGMESTKDMLATKGRASFLGERSRGHIDAGARSSQLIICAIVDELTKRQHYHLKLAVCTGASHS